ncbi:MULTISPECIES: lipase family protein [unclassified Mycobacterium]|uniref:lipase family protein n=1 Tax=unclassified Mycobacterium TaxID=2642494 RepID=UPI0029C83831|nr:MULTISPECIES: lipase family protein [unclassified Mycobacterium]
MSRCGTLLAVLTSAVLLVGCDAHPPERAEAPRGAALAGDFSGSGPGTLVAAESLPDLDPDLRAAASLAARITYVSTSGINDSHPQVSGTVFVPPGDPPPGGWRIVAFGHPATGIQPECAPSASPTLLGSAPDVTALLQAGYVVTMSDYQGLGLAGAYHPFLDSTSEGYDLIDSVRATRKLVPKTSENWVAYGVGQGGQAAWAANELTTDYRGGLNLVGVAAVAPTAALDWLADGAADGTLTADQQLTLQQFVAALAKEYDDFDPDAYRHGVVKDNWDTFSACWGPAFQARAELTKALGPDDLRPDSPDATQVLRGYLQKTSLPQAPTAAPMLVVLDGPDGLIPQAATETALARACAMGDVVSSIARHEDGDETAGLVEWIGDRFDGVPAHNDCPSAPASGAPS